MFKIPSFLSKKFAECDTKEKKEQLVQAYKNWYENDITKLLINDLEKTLEVLHEEEDSKFDFVSLFQSKHTAAHYKGQRKIIKKILNQLNYKHR